MDLQVRTSHGVQSCLTLRPTAPPSFTVETLLCNETGTQLAIVGPRGAAVLELPRRWGRGAFFQGGLGDIACRCRSVDERYFMCHPYVEVRRARWHPASETDSHLVVLSSDNSLRVYETAGSGPALRRIWPLGPSPHGALASAPRLPFLVGLGDTAVDFDFAPPTLDPEERSRVLSPASRPSSQSSRRESSSVLKDANAIQWPILVLHGNGDVSKVIGSLKGTSSECVVQGPLSMFPPAEDNYGADACSLLVLSSTPPVVVVASSAGTLYHCLLLHTEDRDDERPKKPWSLYDSDFARHSPDVALYVLECVELELGLTLDDEVNTVTCPIHLHRHPTSNNRYLCSHDAGVHSIGLPLLPHLEHFINNEDALTLLETPSLSHASVAEYVVCTRTTSNETPAPILGLTFSEAPTVVLIVLLASGEVLSLSLPSVALPELSGLPYQPASDVDFSSPLKELLKEPFDLRIRNMLKHDLTQPILKLSSGTNPSPRETLELVARTTQLFREEYIQKHDQVKEEIEKRIRTLRALKQLQLKELEILEVEKVSLKQTAEQLAEKYEDAKEKQEELSKRAEQLLMFMVQKQPISTNAEKKMAKELIEVKDSLEQFKKGLEQVRAKHKYQREQMQHWLAQQRKRDVYLNQTRASTIRSSLTKVTEEIAELLRTVQAINEELRM